jgi:predicted AAA+ superfamily ATPase
MVFLAGPRQAGKTYLAKAIAQHFIDPLYLNHDLAEHRTIIGQKSWLPRTDLLILDELHKMPEWKNYLKGLFDTKPPHLKLLITGSARLDIFHQSGDSLAGRYFLHHLFPFSIAELSTLGEPLDLDRIIRRSGFPEPYLAPDDVSAERWRMQYINSLITTDVLNFENIYNLKAMQHVFQLLRSRVGSPLSYSSIAEDAGISPTTVKKYVDILEALYIVFRITPHAKNIARSLAKEPKLYFFDTGLVEGDEGVQFENLLAISLYKHVTLRRDYWAENLALHYLRNKDGREVDFALIQDDKIIQIIEVKNQNRGLSASLKWFQTRYGMPATQVVKYLDEAYVSNGCIIEKGISFLQHLESVLPLQNQLTQVT